MTEYKPIRRIAVAEVFDGKADPAAILIGVLSNGNKVPYRTGQRPGLKERFLHNWSINDQNSFSHFYSIDMRPRTIEASFSAPSKKSALSFPVSVSARVKVADLAGIDDLYDHDLTDDVKNEIETAVRDVTRISDFKDDATAEAKVKDVLSRTPLVDGALRIASAKVKIALDGIVSVRGREEIEDELESDRNTRRLDRQLKLMTVFEQILPDVPAKQALALALAQDTSKLPVVIEAINKEFGDRRKDLLSTLAYVNGWLSEGKIDSDDVADIVSGLLAQTKPVISLPASTVQKTLPKP